MPNEFSRYFQLIAQADNGDTVVLTETGVPYSIGNLGSVVIIGLADLAPSGTTVDAAYAEDHDNYYDIILKGDQTAIEALTDVRMPSQDVTARSITLAAQGMIQVHQALHLVPSQFRVKTTPHHTHQHRSEPLQSGHVDRN